MGKVFNIFCPNKHRVSVQAEDNKTLLQIFEEFCKKKGYPLNKYGLTFQGRNVDMSQTVRRSNLPNNCLLEMVESTIKISSEVDIALQLTDGSRPIVKCSPELNLYEMLKKFAQTYKDSVGLESVSEPERTPVIQYLSEEVVGRAALETKTLKKLGIIGGRTLLRFLIRPVTSTELRAAVQQAETELAKEKQLDSQFEARIQANLERNKVDSEVNEGPVELGLPRSQPVGIPIPQSNTPETPCNTPVVPSMLNNTGVRLSQLHYTLEALNQNLRGNVPLPDEVVQMNPVLHDSVAQAQLVQDYIISGRSQLGAVVLGHQVNFAQISPTHQSPFKFPEETRGQNLFSKENEDVNETIDPCDRQPVVFRMEEKMEISSAEPIVELSEEDFELTPEDLQLYQKRLKEQRAYVTSSKENKERMRRAYVYSVVRFLLPDGHILQGTFKSLERVSVMYDFIKELLEDSNLSFTIYLPPNQAINKQNENLLDAGVAPKSSLRVRFTGEIRLKPAVSQQLESYEKADEVLRHCLSKNGSYEPSQIAVGMGVAGGSEREVGMESNQRPATRRAEASEKPKWLSNSKGKK